MSGGQRNVGNHVDDRRQAKPHGATSNATQAIHDHRHHGAGVRYGGLAPAFALSESDAAAGVRAALERGATVR